MKNKIFQIIIVILVFTTNLNAQEIDKRHDVDYKIRLGETQRIVWDTSYFNSDINIYLWNGEKSKDTLIVSNYSGLTGYYNWLVPSDNEIGDYFRVKIELVSHPNRNISTQTFFAIHPSGGNTINSTNDENSKIDLKVYPNPSSSLVKIQANNNISDIIIFDNTGKEIINIDNLKSKIYSINMSDYANGLYIFQISFANGQIFTEKVIISE